MPETTDLGRKILASVKITDADKGEVEALFSRFDSIDKEFDLTLPGAFEDGAQVKISAWNHESWYAALPVGRGKIRTTKEGAVLEGKFFLTTQRGEETFEVVKQLGDLAEWSYGYDILETGEVTDELKQRGVMRVLKKLRVLEVSPVIRGAGVDTGTLSVKGFDGAPPSEEEVLELCDRCSDRVKAMRADARKLEEDASAKAMKEYLRFQRSRASGLYLSPGSTS